MNKVKEYFSGWTVFEYLLIIISTVLIAVSSFMWQSPWYSYVASITGIWCVVLVAKGRISNYWFGLVNVLFYAYSAYMWKLYGEVMLNMIYFLPMQFYGFWVWTRKSNIESKDAIKVKFLSNKMRIVWGIITAIGVFGYKLVLEAMGGNLPLVDSMSTVLSVIAMILMARRYMEQWILWIVVDVVSVIMWFTVIFKQGGNDMALLIMWLSYGGNAIYGCINWIKMYQKQKIDYLVKA